MEDELEDGKFRSVSCPETRCPTPKNPHETPDTERGSTTDLIVKKSTSTYDRISGILASFRDTRKALDESLRKNRELLEYVDGMETPRSKLNFIPSILGRFYKKKPDTILPVHQNDLRGTNAASKELETTTDKTTPTITSEDLETITTEIHRLEKEDSFEARNVKGTSPTTKPKSFPGQQQQQQQEGKRSKHQQRKNVNVADKYAHAKDYGNFDFCVVEKKKMNLKGTTPSRDELSTVDELLVADAFPRRRRPVNRFAASPSGDDESKYRENDSGEVKERTDSCRKTTGKVSVCNLCICSALISVALIALAVLIMLHPSVQLYLRLHTNYIHVLNPPV